MASVSAQDEHANNGRPVTGAPAQVVMVRQVAIAAEDPTERVLKRQVPAWVVSVVLHTIVFGGIFAYSYVTGVAGPVVLPENQVLETKVENAPAEKQNFQNEDIGLNPDKPTNYNNDRIEDISVPGKVVPEAAVGIEGAPQGPPQTVPPPPGFGGGQGAGIESDADGAGQMFGQAGGFLGGRSLPGVAFAGRSAATREKMLAEGGGNSATEAAVAKGLAYLVRTQKGDGRWVIDGGATDDVAATALALLPFFAAGQTHKPLKGEKESPFAKTVEYGLNFLKAQQKSNGCFGEERRSHMMYAQAIAVMAVCEAYGMTQDPGLKRTAQLGLDYLVKAQHPAGGFRYRPREPGDTSVTGWCLQALKSGYLAGLNVPRDVMTKVGSFLDTMQAMGGGTYGYLGPNATPNMTAVGLLCRQYLGWGPKNPALVAGVEYLKKRPPQKGQTDFYYLYYASQVLHFYGGDDWMKFWNPKMRDLLLDTQDNSTGALRGSWAADGSFTGRQGGRHTTTCLALLTLEVYYRHLPLYKRDSSALKDLD